jgi:hypothetical protein
MKPTVPICSSFFCSALLAGGAVAGELDAGRLESMCPGVVAWLAESQQSEPGTAQRDASDPVLRVQLLRMAQEDQDARTAVDTAKDSPAEQNESRVDREHLVAVRKIVAAHGIPSPEKVGNDGLKAFWTLIEHASGDVRLQKAVLDKFESRKFGIPPDEIAALVDKIRVNEHRSQVYGSQFDMIDGRLVISPVEDASNIDARRLKIGLMKLSDYKCMLQVMYGVPVG